METTVSKLATSAEASPVETGDTGRCSCRLAALAIHLEFVVVILDFPQLPLI
jgi:hypothetical protein